MIGLVVVSHSERLAAGVAELAGQMAPSVVIAACGGDGSGGLGTDYAAVVEALAAADSGDGVVVLFDLGSARMVADMAAEVASAASAAEAAGPVLVVDAPLVEGAVAAAVRAQGGASLAEVAAAAVEAGAGFAPAGAGAGAGVGAAAGAGAEPGGFEAAAGPGVPGAGAARGVAGAAPDPSVAATAALGVAPVVPADAADAADAADVADTGPGSPSEGPPGEPVRAEVRLLNEVGLHARPAALVVRALDPLDASVTVRFGSAEVDAKSVLALMGLGAPGGATVEVVARGADAAEAVRRVRELAERRFDE